MRFAHNSVEQCETLLRQHRAGFERCLILTETVFSMEGDVGPIAELALAEDLTTATEPSPKGTFTTWEHSDQWKNKNDGDCFIKAIHPKMLLTAKARY